MNWKNFCEKLADAVDALSHYPAVPAPSESVDRQQLPVLSDLFGLRQDGNRQVWRRSWKLVGGKAHSSVPSVASGRR
jgi:hypothetical protein